MLNINRLRLLRELSARGTIAAVAEALYLTPPSVSYQLAVLEREVGVPLLERTARSVRLTDAGARLAAHAETIIADCEEALSDVASFSASISGCIALSTFQTAAQTVALPALVRLREEYPNLTITASEAEPVRAIPDLRAGVIDIALSHEWDFVPLAPDPALDRTDLLSEPIVVLLPKHHRLAGASVRLSELAEEPWCVAQESTESRKAVDRVAHIAGFNPRIVLESNYFRAIGSAVQEGLGVGVAPLMTDLRGLDIDVQPLIEPELNRRVFAATRRGSSGAPAMRVVLDTLVEVAAKALETDWVSEQATPR